MKKSPKVSIIVTTYNRRIELTKTINSILEQTFENFELIIIDNYSNYNFIELINSFNDGRIKSFQNKNHGIIAINRNYGIKKAKGEYLAFCDDDDVWFPQKIEKQIMYLTNHKSDLVYSNIKLIFNDKTSTITNYSKIDTLNKLLLKSQITLSSVMVKNHKNILFNEDKALIAVEDYELWIRLKLLGLNFTFIKEPLVGYSVVDNSISRQSKMKNEMVNVKFELRLLKNYNLELFSRLIVCYVLLRRSVRYLIFSILKI